MNNFYKLLAALDASTRCNNPKIRDRAARLLGQIAHRLVERLPDNEQLQWDGKIRKLVADGTEWH